MMSEGTSPFHEGERAVQQRLGVHEEIEPWARKVVRSYLPHEHRAFYRELPFLVAAARDGEGRPWATLLTGEPGFVRSPEARMLEIAAKLAPGDALARSLGSGADIGLLGIEFATRRRNRVNGTVGQASSRGLEIVVGQSFGNCPQYIREREWEWHGADVDTPLASASTGAPARELTPQMQAWIERADTFFIASGHRGGSDGASYGMDASHRGGDPGFVQVKSARRLSFPDYAGNNHYNTIGNLVMDPRVGLLFVDFERGRMLQITGRASIDWESPAVASVAGARRLVDIEIDEIVVQDGSLPLRWVENAGEVCSLRVLHKRRESADVVSFVFEAQGSGVLPDFEAGQHLPIEIEVPGFDGRQRRTYSLSSGPSVKGERPTYRISVKRESMGTVSRHLHDTIEEGDLVHVRAPAGDFVLRPGTRPVVLVSAGVGVTPMVSMLHALASADDDRSVWFVHGARDGRHHPLASEVRSLAAATPRLQTRVAYSRPLPQDRVGEHFDRAGRVDAAWLDSLLPELDADFYLCGPVGFMAGLQSELEERGVPPQRIHSESFGPAGGASH